MQDSNQSLSLQRLARNGHFACSKSRYDRFQKGNAKGADQPVWMHMLFCSFVVRKPPKTGFLAPRPILFLHTRLIFIFANSEACGISVESPLFAKVPIKVF